MIVAAALLIAALAASSTLTLAWALRNQQRAHERERGRLIDQVCHLAGKPWALPPRDLVAEPEPVSRDEPDLINV